MKNIWTLLICTALYSCASISPLSGGKADETPPLLLHSNITKTEFKSTSIEMEFDEYIETDNPSENIKIYPQHTTFKTTINKRKLIIKLDSSLHQNTSYVLTINKGIKDVHGGNGFDYKKVFSTGENLDTGYIKVRVKNYKKYKNIKIALLEDLPTDSLRVINKSYSYNLTSETNEFFGLKDKKYHIWLFTDANSDNKPDWYQPINFINNIKTDSIYEVDINDWSKAFAIKRIVTDNLYSKIYYNHNPHYYYHLFDIFGKQLENAVYLNEDSALIYNLKYGANKSDTTKSINIYNEKKSIVLSGVQIIKMKNRFTVFYNKPQFYTEYSNYRPLTRDKTIYTALPEIIQIYVPQEEKMDSFSLKNIPVQDHTKLSYLEFEIKDQFNQLYDVKLIKDDKTILSLYDVKKYEIFLEPGQYKIEVYKRSFTNIFNPFEFKNSSSPIYAKDLILKASWDEILSIIPQ